MVFSKFQEAIFDFVESGSGSAVVIAVAGSGKTSTIVECARRIPENLAVTFCAFNKSIAEELSSRLPSYVRAQTLNSLGYRALMRYLGTKGMQLDSRKTMGILKECLLPDQARLYGGGLRRLVALAKAHGIVPAGMPGTALLLDTEQNWADLIEHYNVDFEKDADPMEGIEHARRVLRESIKLGTRIIDFDDQLYLPVIWGATFYQHDVLFVDEAQDVNAIQRAMIRMALKPEGRGIFVGDPAQCHPAGTMIAVSGGRTVPIEQITPGTEVVSYHDCFRGICSQGRKILATRKRSFLGDLLHLSANGEEVEVTPNHRVPTRLPEMPGYLVYLMEQGHTSRLGTCQMMYKEGFGPSMRLRHERADHAWALRYFASKEDALIYETVTALEFGLPENIFFEKGRLRQRLVAAIGDNRERANRCLLAHGRRYQYPLCVRNGDTGHIGRYLYVTQACNLIDGVNLLRTFDGTRDGGSWAPVTITTRQIDTPVYSLEVEPTEGGLRLYVANNLLVHNSIYGFRGADTEAIQHIKEEFSAKEFPLSVSYRCPRAIVRAAQSYVDYILPSDTAPEGKVLALDQFGPETFEHHDAILCRNNAPLIGLAFTLLGVGTACKVLGRDIGQGLVRLIEKMDAETIEDLEEKLDTYQERETRKLVAKGKEDQAAGLDDRVATIRVFIAHLIEGKRTIGDLVARIEGLFSDNGNGILTLSTIHKAKGLEWDRVFILDAFLMPSRWARQNWQVQQERNICYVAITRAKAELYYIDSCTWREKEESHAEESKNLETAGRH